MSAERQDVLTICLLEVIANGAKNVLLLYFLIHDQTGHKLIAEMRYVCLHLPSIGYKSRAKPDEPVCVRVKIKPKNSLRYYRTSLTFDVTTGRTVFTLEGLDG